MTFQIQILLHRILQVAQAFALKFYYRRNTKIGEKFVVISSYHRFANIPDKIVIK